MAGGPGESGKPRMPGDPGKLRRQGEPGELLDLAVPRDCPGCGAPGPLCPRCRRTLSVPPAQISPRIAVGVPTWSCGPYAGPRRALVISAKERGDGEARRTIGSVAAAAVGRLSAEGILPHPSWAPPVFVPAPTRDSAARARGGDPVTAACLRAAELIPGARVARLLKTSESAADSAGLGARSRRGNIVGSIEPTRTAAAQVAAMIAGRRTRGGGTSAGVRPGARAPLPAAAETGKCPVILVDDVLTTGATAAHSVLVLASLGVRADLVLVFANA